MDMGRWEPTGRYIKNVLQDLLRVHGITLEGHQLTCEASENVIRDLVPLNQASSDICAHAHLPGTHVFLDRGNH